MNKKVVIDMLKNSEDYISGQSISEKLNISRTAIWKIIKKLQDDGYKIESKTNKGYKLIQGTSILNQNEITEGLKTQFKVIVLESVGSTNKYLKNLADNGEPTKTVVISREQTLGKGRLGRTWVATKDENISMSVLLRPNLMPKDITMLPVLVGLCVCKAIKEVCNIESKLKWPNDIIINNKKICGILLEMSAEYDNLQFIIIGIGINCNNTEFPEEIAHKASSIYKETNLKINQNLLTATILNKIDDIITKNYKINTDEINEYRRLCASLNRDVEFIRNSNKFIGHAIDINQACELVVKLKDNTIINISTGEVTSQGIY